MLGLQDKQAAIIERMDKDLRSRNYLVDKLMKEGDTRDKLVKEAQQKINDLENKSIDNENRLFSLNTDMESFKMNYQIFQRNVEGLKEKMVIYDAYGDRISNCEREIEDLKKEIEKANRPVFSGNDGVDPSAIDDMLDNFRKEMYTIFAKREELEKLGERVQKLEEDYTGMDTKLNDTSSLATSNKEEIDKLKLALDGKLDSDVFDQTIANLQEAIKNAGGDVSKVATNTSGSFSTKDMSKIKDMLSKFPDLEKAIEKLRNEKAEKSDLDSKADKADLEKLISELNALRDLLNQLSKDMDFLKASGTGSGGEGADPQIVLQITNKIEKLEIKIGNLENDINGLKKAKPQQVAMPPPTTDTGIDGAKLDSFEKRLDGLESDFDKFNSEIVKEVKNHQDQINGKADYSQLEELKDFLLGKIDDLMRGFKQFADKNDTKKALKNLEKQLKNLYDLVMSKLSGHDEDDAMFSKKPLGGFSCASCEKNLLNLYGKPAEHHSWNKFPLRDPAERIARVGQGFSRMLSSMKPETNSRFQGVSTKYPNQYYEEDQDGNHDQTQPVRTQQNFYPGQVDYAKRPDSSDKK